MIWQSPGLPGWWKVNLITVTHRPHHPNITAGLYCLATSPGFLPTLCEEWSGFFYVHRVFLSYTRDRRLKVSSERLGNEDKAPCLRALLPGRGSNRGPPVWKSEALTARPRQLLNDYFKMIISISFLWFAIFPVSISLRYKFPLHACHNSCDNYALQTSESNIYYVTIHNLNKGQNPCS